MAFGTLYKALNVGDGLIGRAIFPAKFVEYYKLDVELADPDSHFPSEYPIKAIPSFRYEDGDTLTESIPISFLRKYYYTMKSSTSSSGTCILEYSRAFN